VGSHHFDLVKFLHCDSHWSNSDFFKAKAQVISSAELIIYYPLLFFAPLIQREINQVNTKDLSQV